MTAPLDEQYFTWLYSQIGSLKTRDKSRTYWNLARQLFTKEFVWIVPNDDNRVEDGRNLRLEFVTEQGVEGVRPDWFDIGCSMLEMLVGLSRRLSFEAGGEPREWFFQLVENLGLYDLTDNKHIHEREVDRVLERVIWRNYEPDGNGGLFPLKYADRDQREIEIWYQMNSYLLELE